MSVNLQIGYYFINPDSNDFNLVCVGDKDVSKDETLKDEYVGMIDDIFNFFKTDFINIYFLNSDVQGWNNNNEQYLTEYSFRVISDTLKQSLMKFNNVFYNNNNINQFKMELKMSTPYQFWSEKSLKDELKRRNISEKEYHNISDKDTLIEMIVALDKKKKVKDKPAETKPEKKSKKKAAVVEDEEAVEDVKDKFSKMDVKKLLAFKHEHKLDCKLFKSMTIDELQDTVRQAYNEKIGKKKSKKTSVDEAVVRGKKLSKKLSKHTDEGDEDEKPSKKSSKKKSGVKKIAKSDLPDDYIEARKAERRKRELKRKKQMSPDMKEKLDAFRKKFKGQKINWNNKLKKAGLWINGMNFLSNYEKHEILIAKGSSQKKLMDAAKTKVEQVAATIANVNKKKVDMLS